jgi:hypothetical protein
LHHGVIPCPPHTLILSTTFLLLLASRSCAARLFELEHRSTVGRIVPDRAQRRARTRRSRLAFPRRARAEHRARNSNRFTRSSSGTVAVRPAIVPISMMRPRRAAA